MRAGRFASARRPSAERAAHKSRRRRELFATNIFRRYFRLPLARPARAALPTPSEARAARRKDFLPYSSAWPFLSSSMHAARRQQANWPRACRLPYRGKRSRGMPNFLLARRRREKCRAFQRARCSPEAGRGDGSHFTIQAREVKRVMRRDIYFRRRAFVGRPSGRRRRRRIACRRSAHADSTMRRRADELPLALR